MSYLSTNAELGDARFAGHVWRAKDRRVCATVDVTPAVFLSFGDPADARNLAAACLAAAEAMERFEDGEPPDGR